MPHRPPRLATAVLRLAVHASDRQQVLDDLRELYSARVQEQGARQARGWYRRQALGSIGARVAGGRPARQGSNRGRGAAAWLTGLGKDLRIAARALRRSPGFALTATLTLALGIGATTAMLAVVDAVLLRPLPYRDVTSLVRVWESNPDLGFERDWPSPANFLDWEAGNRAFAGLAAWWQETAIHRGPDRARQLDVAHVTGEFFTLLDARPLIGRALTPADATGSYYDNSGNHYGPRRPVVIGEEFWRSTLGGDPAVLGRSLEINRQSWTVVGVMPRDFALPRADVDLWNPWDLAARPAAEGRAVSRDSRFLGAVARLAPGLDRATAEVRLGELAAVLAQEYPETNAGWGVRLTPLRAELLGPVRGPLLLLLGAVVLVLLIACANIAGLSLARAVERAGEMAVRRALGASRRRLAGQLMAEAVLLVIAGALLGLGVAAIVAPALVAMQPLELRRAAVVALDARMALLCGLVMLTSLPLFGILPAWTGSLADASASLRGTGPRASAGRRTVRLRAVILVGQVAVAFVLLVVAGQLATSFANLMATSPGFDPERVLIARVPLEPRVASSAAGRVGFFEQLQERLRELPAVEEVGAVTALPMSSIGADFDRPYWRQGEPDPGADAPEAMIRMATPGYFRAVGRPLLAGRAFERGDRLDFDDPARSSQERVIVVSAALARLTWPDASAIGQAIVMDYPRREYVYRVVGVVGDVRHHDLREAPQAEIFIPYYQNPYPALNVAVRVSGEPSDSADSVLAVVAELNPDQPVHSVLPMQQLVADSVARERFAATLAVAFAVAALLVTAVGLYGVVAYWVGSRIREVGIRLALGAASGRVRSMVLAHGVQLAALGTGAGAVVAWAGTRWLQSMLHGVDAGDPGPYLVAAAAVLLIALPAVWLPARRAAALAPVSALRGD